MFPGEVLGPDAQFVDVRDADLMSEPVATSASVYERSGATGRPGTTPRSATTSVRPKDAHGVHRYSLADTGLDPAKDRARFRRYQDRFDVPDEIRPDPGQADGVRPRRWPRRTRLE